MNFYSKIPSSSIPRMQLESEDVKGNTKQDTPEDINKDIVIRSSECQLLQAIPKPKPSQSASRNKIVVLESELNSLKLARDTGIATDDAIKRIATLRKYIQQEKNILKRKISAAERQKKSRDSKKQKILELCESNAEFAAALKIRDSVGRPRVEENQSGVLDVLKEIAIFGGAADDRRRTETIRCCKTLDDLQAEFCKQGYSISRSGLYLRLLPRRLNTEEGKRHIITVPVKLCKPDSTLHLKHKDGTFCTVTIRNLESLASILGPDQVFFLSMDEKARVPLGITAANVQAPILMQLDYRVKLPDHDFVVAEKHKLVPSVYAGIVIKKDGEGKPEAVTHSGPTYVAIRSGKHSSSNAETHATDIHRLSEMPAFEKFMKTREGFIKPVFIFTCDGGPDENPRYERVIVSAIQHFKDFDLDAIYIATNAPGRSAFNRVERRMAPLSRELTGVVLKYDNFGSHLDSSNRTTDLELEKRNFESAGIVLANIWSQLVIDDFPVVAEYIGPTDTGLNNKRCDLLDVMATKTPFGTYLFLIILSTVSGNNEGLSSFQLLARLSFPTVETKPFNMPSSKEIDPRHSYADEKFEKLIEYTSYMNGRIKEPHNPVERREILEASQKRLFAFIDTHIKDLKRLLFETDMTLMSMVLLKLNKKMDTSEAKIKSTQAKIPFGLYTSPEFKCLGTSYYIASPHNQEDVQMILSSERKPHCYTFRGAFAFTGFYHRHSETTYVGPHAEQFQAKDPSQGLYCHSDDNWSDAQCIYKINPREEFPESVEYEPKVSYWCGPYRYFIPATTDIRCVFSIFSMNFILRFGYDGVTYKSSDLSFMYQNGQVFYTDEPWAGMSCWNWACKWRHNQNQRSNEFFVN